MKNSEWILMMGFPILTVVTMLFLLFSYQAGSSTMGYLTVSFGMVIMNAIMFLLLQYVSVREKKMYQLQYPQRHPHSQQEAFLKYLSLPNSAPFCRKQHIRGMLELRMECDENIVQNKLFSYIFPIICRFRLKFNNRI